MMTKKLIAFSQIFIFYILLIEKSGKTLFQTLPSMKCGLSATGIFAKPSVFRKGNQKCTHRL